MQLFVGLLIFDIRFWRRLALQAQPSVKALTETCLSLANELNEVPHSARFTME